MASLYLILLLCICAGMVFGTLIHAWIERIDRRRPHNHYIPHDELALRRRIERNGFKSRAGIR